MASGRLRRSSSPFRISSGCSGAASGRCPSASKRIDRFCCSPAFTSRNALGGYVRCAHNPPPQGTAQGASGRPRLFGWPWTHLVAVEIPSAFRRLHRLTSNRVPSGCDNGTVMSWILLSAKSYSAGTHWYGKGGTAYLVALTDSIDRCALGPCVSFAVTSPLLLSHRHS